MENQITNNQIYFINQLVGKALLENKITNKQDLYDKLDFVDNVELTDFNKKEASQIIKTLQKL